MVMNSADLPVTEWWDPEWDVYDVPGSPYDPQPAGCTDPVGEADFDAWWAAYEHCWILGWITNGTAPYIPFQFQHQLTTGPAVLDITEAGAVLERILRELATCRCHYDLRPVDGITGMFELDPFRHGWHRGVYAFRIDPRCPHHGDARLADHLEVAERGFWAYEGVLDATERRGH